MNIVIIDYGIGNILSLIGALQYIGIDKIDVSSDYEKLKNADKLLLPGVGSFAKAMETIKEKKIHHYLKEIVVENKKPILGICLGMQLMALSSTEKGENTGLGFVDGVVKKLNNKNLKIPHVGFNQVKINHPSRLYDGMHGEVDFYFTHSFALNAKSNINQCLCYYGSEFVASYESGNIAGVQFHPELSQYNGLRLIRNFIEKF